MKKLLFIFLFGIIAYGAFAQNKVTFSTGDYNEFSENMRNGKKNYLVYYSANWCGPCKIFQTKTLADPSVQKYLAGNYSLYNVDVDKQKELVKRFKVKSIPTVIVFNSNGGEVYRFTSVVPAKRFLRVLKMVD